MKIVLQNLTLINFKGIKNLRIDFDAQATNIFGQNGSGKTTVFDAFVWLLFGKDSHDRTNFEIKPLDSSNKPASKIENEVSATLLIDGKTMVIRRVLRENWVKKKGTSVSEFKGNETLYFWNDVPLQLKDFQTKINDIVNEGLFKLITNTLYFNQLKWQDRRQVLLQIAGDISNRDVLDKIATLQNKQEVFNLTNVLNSGKSITEYKAEIAAKKKKLRTELEAIPTRIDEITRNTPEAIDFSKIRAEISEIQGMIDNVDASINDKSKALSDVHQKKSEKQQKTFDLRTSLNSMEFTARQTASTSSNDRKYKIDRIKSDIATKEKEITLSEQAITNFETQREHKNGLAEELRGQWHAVNSEELVIDETTLACPTCKTPFDVTKAEGEKDKLRSNFLKDKTNRLRDITNKGQGLKIEIDGLSDRITKGIVHVADTKEEVRVLKQELEVLHNQKDNTDIDAKVKELLADNVDYQTTLAQLTELEAEVIEEPVIDLSALKTEKSLLTTKLNALNKSLNDEDVIKRATVRISELHNEERDYAQQLADLEGTELLIEEFNRKKMDELENRINGRFSIVKFKMFETQINGGQVEACETLINGVPFSDANTASKINAGLDIINTLCNHYNVYAPIFIDNRESVSAIIHCQSQIINLIVSPSEKQLKVA